MSTAVNNVTVLIPLKDTTAALLENLRALHFGRQRHPRRRCRNLTAGAHRERGAEGLKNARCGCSSLLGRPGRLRA